MAGRDSDARPPESPRPRDGLPHVSQALRLASGRVFAGDFKVVRPLKAGGQGSLYVVEQLSTSKQRALKLMLPELVAQPSSRRRFEQEAKIAARIQSDHVVESIASGVDAATGTPWLVMELLEGEDLAAYNLKKKRLPPSEVLEIFSQVCHALGEAHRQGIVHRDLKPENIFLATARRRGVPFMVKLLDFGIARILAESQTVSGATSSGIGTPMWMAPEQTIPGGPVSPATDVWPLGLIAFRLLTGYLFWKAPYDPGASVMMLMAEAFMHPLPSASDRADHYKCKDRLPAGFDAWFAKCVARPMEERFRDASEAFGALEPLLVTFGDEAPAPAPSRASYASNAGIKVPAPSLGASEPLPTPPASEEPSEPAQAAPLEPRPVTGPAVAASTNVGLGPAPTGPGRATWEGAPELPPELLQSDVGSGPVSPPPNPRTSSPTADQAPPVQTSSLPAPNRTRNVVVSAAAAGVLIGAVIFGIQRSHGPAPGATVGPAHATPTATAEAAAKPTPSAPPSASTTAEPEPDPSTTSAAAGVTAVPSAEPVTPSGHRGQRLCKAAGSKCFSNDDCCDRACKKWICRPNAALHDPYGD